MWSDAAGAVRNAFSDWQEVRREVPQGSVLGPMFLNIYIYIYIFL